MGNGALYCDNDALISLYTDVASIINVPVMMEVRLINKKEGVLSVILRIQLTYLSESNDRYRVTDRTLLIFFFFFFFFFFFSVEKSNFGWLKTLVYDNVKSVAGIFF